MNEDLAIKVTNVSKVYKLYDKPSHRLKEAINPFGKKYHKEFYALNDVSIEVKKGETIGIVGKNGSGKSTLLQLISGVLTSSSGTIDVNGKISALLELGAGFNPELTGIENIFLNGIIMGLTRDEMSERINDIISFADIGEFVYQPVKVYSSGMFVRLAFACAVNADPEILIVDEALAVGDIRFQLKCIDKKKGKTILFVSHETSSIRNFCERAIWLMDGRTYVNGEVNRVIDLYNDFMKIELENNESPQINEVVKKDILSIKNIHFVDEEGNKKNTFRRGESIKVIVDYIIFNEVEGLIGGVALFDKQYVYISGLNTQLDNIPIHGGPGSYRLELTYQDVNLLPGTYFIDVGFYESSGVVSLEYKRKEKSFFIETDKYLAQGLILMNHLWKFEKTKG